MEESKFKFMWSSICFIVFWIGLIFLGSWINTPTNYEFTFNVNADNETKESLKYLSEIKEHQVKQNSLYCENQLLNQSKMYEQSINSQELYWKSYCRDINGYFRVECWE